MCIRDRDIDGLEFSPYGYGPGGSSANCGGFTGNSTNGCGGDTLAAVTEAITAWHATVIRLPLNQEMCIRDRYGYCGFLNFSVNVNSL